MEKIGSGGVYVTDPAVATFSGPELTDRAHECGTVAKPFEKGAILQAPNANRLIELSTVAHSDTLAFCTR